jgi:putative ABC transport system substrate-binding protein
MHYRLRRREFVQGVGAVGLALVVGCGRVAWPGQPAQRSAMPRIGYLSPFDAAGDRLSAESFQRGLGALGYTEGQDVRVERRYAEGSAERLSGLAEELAGLPSDVIVVAGAPAARAARAATQTIPIVMAIIADPVGAGLVASLAHPAGNVTGLTSLSPELGAKRLELLREIVPSASRLALLWDSSDPDKAGEFRATEAAARFLGLQVQPLGVRGVDDVEGALEAARTDPADVLTALANPTTVARRKLIVDFANANRQPSIYNDRLWVQDGGLMAYGANPYALFGRAAYYVDRILKGARPADLPVEQPSTFDFIVNLHTARTLGLTIPPQVLAQATEVVQ